MVVGKSVSIISALAIACGVSLVSAPTAFADQQYAGAERSSVARGHYARARQLLQNRETQQAVSHLQKSVQVAPGFQPAVDLLQRLTGRPAN